MCFAVLVNWLSSRASEQASQASKRIACQEVQQVSDGGESSHSFLLSSASLCDAHSLMLFSRPLPFLMLWPFLFCSPHSPPSFLMTNRVSSARCGASMARNLPAVRKCSCSKELFSPVLFTWHSARERERKGTRRRVTIRLVLFCNRVQDHDVHLETSPHTMLISSDKNTLSPVENSVTTLCILTLTVLVKIFDN